MKVFASCSWGKYLAIKRPNPHYSSQPLTKCVSLLVGCVARRRCFGEFLFLLWSKWACLWMPGLHFFFPLLHSPCLYLSALCCTNLLSKFTFPAFFINNNNNNNTCFQPADKLPTQEKFLCCVSRGPLFCSKCENRSRSFFAAQSFAWCVQFHWLQ